MNDKQYQSIQEKAQTLNKVFHRVCDEVRNLDEKCQILNQDISRSKQKLEQMLQERRNSANLIRKRKIKELKGKKVSPSRKRRKKNNGATEFVENKNNEENQTEKNGDYSEMQQMYKKYEEVAKLAKVKYNLTCELNADVNSQIDRLDKNLYEMEKEIRKNSVNSIPTPIDEESLWKILQKSEIKEKVKKGENFINLELEDVAVFLRSLGRYSDAEFEKWKRRVTSSGDYVNNFLAESRNCTANDLLYPGQILKTEKKQRSYWCFCKKVAKGEMIACDNPECTIEWFHFECVRLSAKPSGKWYCQKCRTLKDNLVWDTEIT